MFDSEDVFCDLLVENQDFSDTALREKEFENCQFVSCNFSGADLSSSIFENCVFTECKISNPLIKQSRIIDCKFVSSKLSGITFFHCNQISFDLEFLESSLLLCNFTDAKMKKSKFVKCQINECYFQNTLLAEVDFSGSVFGGSLFSKCDLQKAKFAGSSGFAIDPRDNNVRKAVFDLPGVLGLLGSFDILLKD
ncbi:MAG: pentapeptide repeat-containing protein [Spirochaetales bacterium]|nr:pentapeptide repeat-containing protein [Spirochaetales bacterium]